MYTIFFVVMPFFLVFSCAAGSPDKEVTKQESFIVKKKKVSGRAGRKSKEQACREFADCVKSGSELVERVARVQGFALDQTAQYLNGEDPFSGIKKADIKELVRRSELLEQKIDQLCQECDNYICYTNGLFTRHTAVQTPQG